MKDNSEAISFVHHIVSTANEMATGFEELLKAPDETFVIPRNVIESVRSILIESAFLTQRHYETIDQIREQFQEQLNKIVLVADELEEEE